MIVEAKGQFVDVYVWPPEFVEEQPSPPALFNLTDATSNASRIAGDACARSRGGAVSATTRTGAISTSTPGAVAVDDLLPTAQRIRGAFLIIRSILFLRSEPVTPATQVSGDSR